MTSSPIIAKPQSDQSSAQTTSGSWLLYIAQEWLRSLAILLAMGAVVIFLTGGLAQLYFDIDDSTGGNVDGLLPSVDALRTAWDANREVIIDDHIPATLYATLTGFSIAIVLGVLLAAVMDMIAPLRWILYPLLVLSQTIPIFAIAVLLIILFGFNFGPKIIVVTLFCFFPITINTLGGLQSVDPAHTHMLRAMGASHLQTWWKVRLPTAMPSFFSGLRIAATYSVVGAVIGEYVGSGDGLGKFLQRSYRSFDTDQTYLAIAVIAAISMTLVLMTIVIEVLVLRWRYAGLINSGNRIQQLLNIFK